MDEKKSLEEIVVELLEKNYPDERQILLADDKLTAFEYILQQNVKTMIECNLDILVDSSLFELESMEENEELQEENTTSDLIRDMKKKGNLSIDDYEMIEELER